MGTVGAVARTRYVALLRGINVGGKNPVPMASLREAFEAEGYGAVRTHIASGNVLFEADTPRAELQDDVEALLERRLGLSVMAVVRSHRQLRSVVEKAPEGFADRDRFHSDVLFLRETLTPAKVLAVVDLREGVDQAWAGTGVVYFRRLSERRTQSRMSTIVGTPEYQRLTIRSWSTTTKLLALLDG